MSIYYPYEIHVGSAPVEEGLAKIDTIVAQNRQTHLKKAAIQYLPE